VVDEAPEGDGAPADGAHERQGTPMGVMHQENVVCRNCQKSYPTEVARSINAARFPAFRERIITGTLHRARCPHCATEATIEHPFTYVDLPRRTFIAVKPRGDRHAFELASKELEEQLAKIPADLLPERDRHVRVVYGMGELREKLIAQDAELDDRDIEMLKALVVYDHPFLTQRPRLRMHLTAVDPDQLEFMAGYDHDARSFRITLPRTIAEPLMGTTGTLRRWAKDAHGTSSIYEMRADHWVNMWRWSPQVWALAMLGRYAATLRAGGKINLAAAGFSKMLDQLPRGNRLSAWAKQALREVQRYAQAKGNARVQDRLFEVRFDRGLDDDWSLNSNPTDIATLWDLLKDLPDTHVEGNVKLHDLFLEPGAGGGWYEPGSGDIHIGEHEIAWEEGFQDVVRHEVGHAVHEGNEALVNPWLQARFGWQAHPATNAGIDAWVAEMGGWGPLTAAERQQVRQLLVNAIGPGSTFAAGPRPNPPSTSVWRRAGFGPRLATEASRTNWFASNTGWYRVGGKAFFLNYWYRTFCVVDATTLDLVAQMPSSYASMSHYEFFAEMYALYYDLDDPKRPVIPADVVTWLATNLGAAATGMPAAPTMPSGPTRSGADVQLDEGDATRRPARRRGAATAKANATRGRKPAGKSASKAASKPATKSATKAATTRRR
jgi:CpXC protein